MTTGMHLIETARGVEHDKRPDLRHSTRGRPDRPGRLRSRMGELLVSLGERVAGTSAPTVANHDNCA
ncbi:hypothetical protein HQ535_11180 [bacterium]|nr:hypothetical protein [bacterium]